MKLLKNILISLFLVTINFFVTFIVVVFTVGVIKDELSVDDAKVCLDIAGFVEISKYMYLVFKKYFFSNWNN